MADIANILRDLSRVGGMIRQDKPIPAVQAARAAAQTMRRSQLLRAEHEEFSRLLGEACGHIGNNPKIRKLFPLALEYRPGEEGVLYESLSELLEILEEDASGQAAEVLRLMEERKREMLAKGNGELEAGNVPLARATFNALDAEFPGDAGLGVDIAESYLKHNLYEDAARHLEKAHNVANASAHVYNRLGIALRRIKRFDIAEENFKRALALEPSDPNLYFNLGRVYLDHGLWREAQAAGEKAFALDPAFVEADKLARYAAKKLISG